MSIIKYIILSILISYLLRQVLSTFSVKNSSDQKVPPSNHSASNDKHPKKYTDKLGEYTDYEEIK